MSFLFAHRPARGRRTVGGSALLIVLAMVVLLTGLIVAFLFRSGSGVSIAGSSANTTRADLFGQGAIDTTIGDFQTEIAAGSTAAAYGTNTVYMPDAPTNMIAQVALPAGVSVANYPNLLKMSVPGVKFSAGDTANGGQGRATGVVNGAGLTTTASLNGRFISLSSWNKPLLLPKANQTDTYNFAPDSSKFIAPNWILVARNGSNPTVWNSNLEAIPANASDSTHPVVGRYAYVIYNEGGLLDANVAGSPATGSGASVSYSSMASYKNALAYADLSQLKDSSGNQLLATSDINALVGWRNYASAHASGQFPSYSFPSQSGTTPTLFDLATLFNLTGFLRSDNSTLVNGQSDHMFMSRQQLIAFLAAADPANLVQMQTAMQYLGTFSRALSQPSYAPNPNAPAVNTVTNPAFLTVRAKTAFIRNDGSTAVVNEPLVKKRFALSRLAWLTYHGPSANRNISAPSSTAGGVDYDIYALENQYGVTQAFLAQGTAQNIYNYFGLSWVSDPKNGGSCWVYSHSGTSPVSSSGAGASSILTLANVSGRDPDFFELLKAGICVGSLGKTYGTSGYQYNRDQMTDGSILQIGANIISQSQPSGYPARILANLSGLATPQEYFGDVDLPYIYQVREGRIASTTDSSPAYTSLPPSAPAPATVAGVGYEVQEPVIWNPHAWRSTSLNPNADSLPRPTSFQLSAVNADPTGAAGGVISYGAAWRSYSGPTYNNNSSPDPSPVLPTPIDLSSILTFSIPRTTGNSLFREPTLLTTVGVPANSGLTATSGPAGTTPITGSSTYTSIAHTNVGAPDSRQYVGIVLGTIPLAWNLVLPAGAVSSTSATGTYAVPTENTYLVTSGSITYQLKYVDANGNTVTYDQKYTPVMMANSYNPWKYVSAGYGWPFNGNEIIGTELMATCFDPRTSRFGMIYSGPNGMRGASTERIPPGPIYTTGAPFYWGTPTSGPQDTSANNTSAAAQNALWTMRPDEYQGFIFDSTTMANGFGYPTGPAAGGWVPSGTGAVLSPGLYAQNNPGSASSSSPLRFASDLSGYSSMPTPPGAFGAAYFADPDGVVRRGMAAYVPPGPAPASTVPFNAGAASGVPLKVAYTFSSSGNITPTADAAGRPVMLNRPFRSVTELGYVFSDTPWRNLDLSTPESGNVALLDLFCINDTDDPNGLVAGKVDLNTKQTPVLQAILAGAYEDEFSASIATSSSTTSSSNGPVILASGGSATADKIAQGLVARTSMITTPGGPLENISELVGKWNASVSAGAGMIDGGQSYAGFSGAAATSSGPPSSPPNLSYILSQDSSVAGYNAQDLQRYRAATIRALSSVGQVRVWNLLIDLVAQTGRYPAAAGNLDQFVVEGQKRYWVHVAIDRLTGKVIDKQVEVVNE